MMVYVFLLIFFYVIYMWCYSSIVFVIKFMVTVLTHIRHVVKDGFHDFKLWYKGEIRFNDYGYYIYGGDFGAGKTLNMVKHGKRLVSYYRRFYDVTIYSNIELHFPGCQYRKFKYFEDLEYSPAENEVVIYFIDEAGSILYSRNYSKSRLNEEDIVLALNQVRKDRKCVLMTSQRHKMLDAAIRRVCNLWYDVQKHWRFSFITIYDGFDLEYNPEEARPLKRLVKYATDRERKLYRHDEKVVNLNKERLSSSSSDTDVNVVVNKQRKPRKKRRVV